MLLAAHNARFDLGFLKSEYKRIDQALFPIYLANQYQHFILHRNLTIHTHLQNLARCKHHMAISYHGRYRSNHSFKIGKYSLNFYHLAELESTFGVVGSLVLLMIWVSYSCMILFIGAEFSHVYEQEKYNRKIIPSKIAKHRKNE